VREVSLTLATLAVALAVVAAAVHVGYDRSTLVPPADAVTESFARQIATGRFDLAMNFLAAETRRRESPQTRAARFAAIDPEAGKVDDVQADLQWMQQDHARARAEVTLRGRTTSFDVQLVREHGLWRVAELSDLVR
jgi:hypothetical protein